jgi:hypothetical protein
VEIGDILRGAGRRDEEQPESAKEGSNVTFHGLDLGDSAPMVPFQGEARGAAPWVGCCAKQENAVMAKATAMPNGTGMARVVMNLTLLTVTLPCQQALRARRESGIKKSAI